MSGPFATYFGNGRVVAIPPSPTVCTDGSISAATTTTFTTITLGTANTAALLVPAYIHYFYLYARGTAAASLMDAALQWQFRTAAHANVGAAIASVSLTANCSGASPAGVLTHGVFAPHEPHGRVLTVPATAAEIVLQMVTAIAGAPFSYYALGYGIDTTNTGLPGDIGGGGIVAQGTNNPNAF